MARFDSIGLFWEDRAPEKPPKKEKVKPIPPPAVWLEPSYLPNLEEAMNFQPPEFTDEELAQAAYNKEPLVWDIESYPNFFSVAFESEVSGKTLFFWADENGVHYDHNRLKWVLENFLLIDFNGEGYDKWVAAVAAKGATAKTLYDVTQEIIVENRRGADVLKKHRAKRLELNHIDVISLTPGDDEGSIGNARGPSLKMMAGRLESPMMMDLPFPPGTWLSPEQKAITRWYNFNDLKNTLLVYRAHKKNIELREQFGPKYKVDLRSKSDAQMAEAIFRAEAFRRTGRYPQRAVIRAGYKFQFQVPAYVKFETENLQWVLETIRNAEFVIRESGYVSMPEELKNLVIPIGKAKYKMGIGGLHSQEKRAAYIADDEYILRDHDVSSYYPKLILATGLEPPALKGLFRPIYASILEERLRAKEQGLTVAADGLKIVVNGSFGKTLDPWSCLYYPELGIQTTVSGQLSLLMAIEALELRGFQVINANTDGIVVRCHRSRISEMKAIFKQWEQQTRLEMETVDYQAMFSRDVNSYVAIYAEAQKGKWTKGKGVFSVGDIKHNPANDICANAVTEYLLNSIPVEETIRNCRHLPSFMQVRKVKGGSAKVWSDDNIEYIGKIARWYHSNEVQGAIVTANKGHMVPDTTGARPCMRLPQEWPADLDYDWYIQEAYQLLDAIGYNDLFNPQPELVET